jgi:hypothetical protein
VFERVSVKIEAEFTKFCVNLYLRTFKIPDKDGKI